MATKTYLIECLSNLQVGSGEVNYGLIDNLIQRDPITGLPNINSSGLKGAFREYFSQNDKNKKWIVQLFGSDPKEKSKPNPGSLRFFDAGLLFLPVRSNKRPFLMATSVGVLKEFVKRIKDFNGEINIKDKLDALNELIYNLTPYFENSQPRVYKALKDFETKIKGFNGEIDSKDNLNVLNELFKELITHFKNSQPRVYKALKDFETKIKDFNGEIDSKDNLNALNKLIKDLTTHFENSQPKVYNTLKDFETKIKDFNGDIHIKDKLNALNELIYNLTPYFKNCIPRAYVFDPRLAGSSIEDTTLNASYVKLQNASVLHLLTDQQPVVVVSDADFGHLCSDEYLPIIPRNVLENGISANLWYEQVLPRYSRLYFMLMEGNLKHTENPKGAENPKHAENLKGAENLKNAENSKHAENFKKLNEELTNPKTIVQIGANASVGYGFCKIKEVFIKPENHENQ